MRALSVLFALALSTAALAQSADQAITSATDSPDPIVPGNNITYTVIVTNNGPDPAVNGGLNIALSGSLTPVSASAPAGFTCTAPAQFMSCTAPSFAVGAPATITIVATVPASLLNFPDGSVTSNFSTSGVTTDPNNGNNAASVTTSYDSPQIDLSLTVTDSPDPVFPDNDITYTIPVTNAGPNTATSVNFNSFNNGSLKFQSITVPAGWNCPSIPVGSTPTFTCTNPSFAPGTSNFTVVVRADSTVLGLNDGTVSTAFGVNGTGNDTNQSNNNETENTAYVTPDANMGVSVTDSPDPVFPDGNITYTVLVTNAGPDTAPNATLNVFNNGTLRFQSVTPPAGWSCPSPPAVGATPTFQCTNPSFANGGSSTFTIVVQADDAILGINDGTVSTAFTVGSGVSDPNNANNAEQEDTAYVTPDANMGVSVTDAPDPVAPDGNITYTVQVTNAGPDTAPNATLNIFNNGSLRFQSVTAPAGWSCPSPPAIGATPTFQCTNASFANGGSSTFTIVVQADDAILGINDGTVSTNFSVGSGAADPVNANNSEIEDTAYVTPDAELAITNADSPDPVAPGGTITYTQIVTNNGPTVANTTVSQILPASVGFQSINNPGGFNCVTPAIGASGTITCTNASFASGATTTFTLVVNVIASSGTVIDTVQVSSPLQDTIPGNNSAQVTTTILAPVIADLAITKATGSSNAAPGSLLSYTITLTNNGPDAAASVVVTDALPAELLFQSITTPAGFNCTTPAVGATGTITCTAPTMASGTTVTFTLVVQVSGTAVGPINNNATASSNTQDNNAGNSSGSAGAVTIGGSGVADIGVTKSPNTSTAAPGSTVIYTITATNNGPNAATNVVVTDTLPASLLFQSIAAAAGFTCTTPAVGASGTITCTGGPLANGATATFTLTTMISPSATGSVSNTAHAGSNASDANAGNSSATAPIIVATADLSIAKTTNATQAPTGSTLTYTITVTNHGPDAATNVIVSDDLPTGLQFVSAIPSQGSCTPGDPFTCNLGTLNNGATATITLQTLVTGTSGTIANTATVDAATDDGTPGNNSSTSTPIPIAAAAQGEPIPTLSEWALLMMAALLGLVAFAKMR